MANGPGKPSQSTLQSLETFLGMGPSAQWAGGTRPSNRGKRLGSLFGRTTTGL